MRPSRHGGRHAGRTGPRKPGGAPAPRASARKEPPAERGPERFRVLLAVHRPRYRSRAERAVALPGWELRSLLNREDPIGLLNQKAPHLLILSVDTARGIHTGYLRAAQRYRSPAMRVIVLGETPEDAEAAGEMADAVLSPPWKAQDLREIAARLYEELRGQPPAMPDAEAMDEADGQ